jgi:NAD(P)-dependent dehydrogenase (short-subunit alcohol dehydrogenase family)
VNQTQERFGSIDVLVNNAAVSASLRPQAFDAISLEEWDRVMTVNVRGTFQCIAAVAPVMRLQKSGKIVNIASGTVFKGSKGLCHYVASKAAILGLTRALAQELGEFGIGINAIAPGITASDTLVGTPAWTQMNSAVVASRAFKREESPEDLVGALLFLSSPDSDFMTGQCVVVDGGSVLH